MTSHYSEDDLTLYYYGEGRYQERHGGAGPRREVERHLEACPACAALHREIAGVLSMVVPEEVPERGDQYGLEVWQRIRHRLPEGFRGFTRLEGFTTFEGFTRFEGFMKFAAAAAVLMVAAFIAGRYSSVTPANPAKPGNPGNFVTPAHPGNPASSETSRHRVLLTSIVDHLDRSERVLADIMNAAADAGGHDITLEQRWAEDLLTTSRLYRQDAAEAGEQSVASMLDDLERNLLEIVHSPSPISGAALEQLRRRIDAAALLFKVRVMADQLRERQTAPADVVDPRPSTSKIS